MPNAIASDPAEPAFASRVPPHNLETLARMLGQGWRIETPVLARLSWAQRRTGEIAYHIILARAAQRSLVVIPESPEIQRFLSAHAIAIV